MGRDSFGSRSSLLLRLAKAVEIDPTEKPGATADDARSPAAVSSPRRATMAEIEIKTAPADFRFPTTNQTRHCFTRYVEYHRCVNVKGDDTSDCEKFAKYYRSYPIGFQSSPDPSWVEKTTAAPLGQGFRRVLFLQFIVQRRPVEAAAAGDGSPAAGKLGQQTGMNL
nr:unnamed protein product [Digitaria exilis]